MALNLKGLVFGIILVISGLPMIFWGLTTFAEDGFNLWLQFGLADLSFGIGILFLIKFWNKK
jgi:hypothetical protein